MRLSKAEVSVGKNFIKKMSRFLIGIGLVLMIACSDSFSIFSEKADERPFENPLPVNTQPKKMAIGYGFVVAVKQDGTVWSWGTGFHGELGLGPDIQTQYEPKRLKDLSDIIEVAAGSSHVLALKKDGTVWAWGGNKKGQAIGGGDKKVDYPTQIKWVSGIKRIAATADGSAFLSEKGELIGLGCIGDFENNYNYSGKINCFEKPTVFAVEPHAISLYAGDLSVAAIKGNGSILNWGTDYFFKYYKDKSVEFRASDAYKSGNSIFLGMDGYVFVAAHSDSELLGQGKEIRGGGFMRVKNLGRIKKISYSGTTAVALDEKGRIWLWGTSVLSQPDPGGRGIDHQFTPKVYFKLNNVVDIYTGTLSGAAFTGNGSVYFWGDGRGGERTRLWVDHYATRKEWITPEKINWTWK